MTGRIYGGSEGSGLISLNATFHPEERNRSYSRRDEIVRCFGCSRAYNIEGLYRDENIHEFMSGGVVLSGIGEAPEGVSLDSDRERYAYGSGSSSDKRWLP
ncbi:MAG: hypothetical protein O7C39_00230 [Bacteroidetes bacterium]|nr:hypothetical protein [Bacteroidota bacterium]